MKRRTISYWGACLAVMLGATLALSSPAIGDDPTAGAKAVPIPVRMNPDKLAGVDLPAGEPFIAPEAVLEGSHRPRGEVLYQGKELIMEVYEDDQATFAVTDPFPFDEFVWVLSGKLILTDAGGQVHEFVAGDSLVVPKGFTGTWKMLGNYRELVAIGTEAHEKAYAAEEE
jgi:uncharacterized cupin superfamily protein